MSNFTLSGMNRSEIRCDTNTSVMIVNTTNFLMSNMHFIGCGRHHTGFLENSSGQLMFFQTAAYGSSFFIYHCQSVKISNVTITPNVGFAGLLAIEITKISYFKDIKVQANCSALQIGYNRSMALNGIVFHYKQSKFNYVNVIVGNFQYKSFGSCLHYYHFAITLLFRQCYTIYIL